MQIAEIDTGFNVTNCKLQYVTRQKYAKRFCVDQYTYSTVILTPIEAGCWSCIANWRAELRQKVLQNSHLAPSFQKSCQQLLLSSNLILDASKHNWTALQPIIIQRILWSNSAISLSMYISRSAGRQSPRWFLASVPFTICEKNFRYLRSSRKWLTLR